MSRLLLAFTAVNFLLLGCTTRTALAPTVSLQSGARVVSTDNPDRGEVLVWVTKTENDQVKARTYRLSAEGGLNVLGEQDEIVITTTHGDLTWQAREKEIGLAGCGDFVGPPGSIKGTVTSVNLVNASGEVVQKVVDSGNLEGDEVDDLQHHVRLLGSIGPYLFVHEESWMNICGPHGNEMASAMVWDADLGKSVDLWAEIPDKDKLVNLARQKLDEGEETAPADPDDATKPEPAQLIPVYTERGALRIDAQFARWACYSCSDHEWSSYTRSAVVPTDWIPEKMKPWVTPPVVVKQFLEAHREWRLGGWSKR